MKKLLITTISIFSLLLFNPGSVLADPYSDCRDAGNTHTECAGVNESAATNYQNCLDGGGTPSECNAAVHGRQGFPSTSGSGSSINGNSVDIFGAVNPPPGLEGRGLLEGGLTSFINSILGLLIVGAGLFALFNLVTAGYNFMSAGDDPKKVAVAWKKIWQTIMGLAFTAGAFVLAALIGQLVFGNPTQFLEFRIFGVGQ